MWVLRNAAKRTATSWKASTTDYYSINGDIKRCATAAEIEALISNENVDFNSVNCATAIKSLGRFKSKNKPVIEKILNMSSPLYFAPQALSNTCHSIASTRLFDKLPEVFTTKLRNTGYSKYNSQDVANVLWSLAKLDQSEPLVIAKLEKEITERKDLLQCAVPQALANILWSFATMRLESNAVCQAVADELKRRDLTKFTVQELANPLWAFAVLKSSDTELLEKISNELSSPHRNFSTDAMKPQDISNSIWALAVLEFPCPKLCVKICTEVQSFARFRPQELSNTLWAFATLRESKFPMDIARQVVKQNLKYYSPQALSNIAWAFASLEHYDSLVFLRISTELLQRKDLSAFTPEALCTILRSFAEVSSHCSKSGLEYELYTVLFNHICDEIIRRGFSGFQRADLSQLVWSIYTTSYKSTRLCEMLCEELKRRNGMLTEYSLKDLAVATLMMARLVHRDEELICLIANQVLQHGDNGSEPGIVPLLWGMACLDALHFPAVKAVMQMDGKNVPHDSTADVEQQLFQIQLAWTQTHGNEPSRMLQDLTESNWLQTKGMQHRPTSSHWHLKVWSVLREQGKLTQVESEAKLLGGIYVDMLVRDKNAVIEVDGPAHYLSDGNTQNGNTRFKHLLLKRDGFRVFSVPTIQFSKLSMKEKQEYCSALADEINNVA